VRGGQAASLSDVDETTPVPAPSLGVAHVQAIEQRDALEAEEEEEEERFDDHLEAEALEREWRIDEGEDENEGEAGGCGSSRALSLAVRALDEAAAGAAAERLHLLGLAPHVAPGLSVAGGEEHPPAAAEAMGPDEGAALGDLRDDLEAAMARLKAAAEMRRAERAARQAAVAVAATISSAAGFGDAPLEQAPPPLPADEDQLEEGELGEDGEDADALSVHSLPEPGAVARAASHPATSPPSRSAITSTGGNHGRPGAAAPPSSPRSRHAAMSLSALAREKLLASSSASRRRSTLLAPTSPA